MPVRRVDDNVLATHKAGQAFGSAIKWQAREATYAGLRGASRRVLRLRLRSDSFTFDVDTRNA
jgi:hypothetical protein